MTRVEINQWRKVAIDQARKCHFRTGHCASTCGSESCWVDHRDWGPNYNKAGIDGIAKVDGQSKWKLPPERVGGDRFA